MNNEVEKQEEAGLGEAWRGEFAGNLEALHEYPQNATYQWIQVVESLMKLPKPEWEVRQKGGMCTSMELFNTCRR